MKAPLLLLALGLAACWAENASAVVAAYRKLDLIPGADFVGFGYDAKFTDPVQAVRLPLSDWNFQEVKHYRYPVYKTTRFRVPDELFVRTVSKTDFNQYVFQSLEELSEKLAFDAGLNYTRSSTKSGTDLLDDKETAALYSYLFPGGTNTSSANTTSAINSQSGYGNQPFIPEGATVEATALFSVGAEFSFLKTTTKTSSRWIVQNEQVNQFYQLFLDKRRLRAEFVEDALKLAGRIWKSDDRKLFQQFFEKYGTHVVVSAIMGGAISQTSVVDKTATVTTNTATFNLSSNSNVTRTGTTNQTIEQEFIEDSSNCTGNVTGYAYDTFNKKCVEPGSVTCYAPMEFFERFDKLDDDSKSWKWNNGPEPLAIRQRLRYCPKYRFCPWLEDETFSRSDAADPFGLYTGRIRWWIGWYWDIEARYLVSGAQQGWEVVGRGPFFWWYDTVKYYPAEVKTRDDCRNSQCQDRFMGCVFGEACVIYNTTYYRDAATSLAGAIKVSADTGNYLVIDSTNQDFPRESATAPFPRRGRTVDILSAKPQLFQFYVLSNAGNARGEHNIMEMWDGGGNVNSSSDDLQIFKYRHNPYYVGFDQGSSGVFQYPLKINTWYKIMVKVNWANKNFDFWLRVLDRPNPPLVRVAKAIPFINADAARFSKINLFNQEPGSIAYFDELQFCNDEGTKFVPVDRQSAIQTTQAKFKQTVNGQIDFKYENSFSNYVFSQTNNYRLRGGDSSKVDLLDARKTYNTFETWKGTIINNPAPLSFVLKKISHLIPDEVVNGINRRDELSYAVDQFLKIRDTSIIVNLNPDLRRGI